MLFTVIWKNEVFKFIYRSRSKTIIDRGNGLGANCSEFQAFENIKCDVTNCPGTYLWNWRFIKLKNNENYCAIFFCTLYPFVSTDTSTDWLRLNSLKVFPLHPWSQTQSETERNINKVNLFSEFCVENQIIIAKIG